MTRRQPPVERTHDARRASRLEAIVIYGTALAVLIWNWS